MSKKVGNLTIWVEEKKKMYLDPDDDIDDVILKSRTPIFKHS